MKYLINSQEIWHVETEEEAKTLIEDAKKEKPGNLLKYSSQHKEKYNKDGEIVYDYYKVVLNKSFNVEKEPDTLIDVNYYIPKESEETEFNAF